MSDIDGVIKELADTHGYKDISSDSIREVRSILSGSFLDTMLDSQSELPTVQEISNDDGKAKLS